MLLRTTSQRSFSQEQLDQRLRAGLVGHWIGGGSGNTWFDHSGYGNHGVLTGGPTWTLGEGNKRSALSFDGVDDYVDTGFLSPDTFSWSVWINHRDSALYNTIISDGSASYMLMDINTASVGSFWSSDGLGGQSLGVTGLTIGTWNHITFIREGDSITNGYKAYLNGTLTGQANTGTWSPVANLRIGGRSGQEQWFKGIIADVRIYNRALSSAEVAVLASPSFSPVIQPARFFGRRSSTGKSYNAFLHSLITAS